VTSDGASTRSGAQKPWIAVRVGGMTNREAVAAALFEAGSQGVHEDGDSLLTHFPPDFPIDSVRAAVSEADAGASIVVSDAPLADWSTWRASVRAHALGKVTIVPPWMFDERDASHVVIDPAMAFGTGEHATTRGVVRLMQRLPQMPPQVADLGAGSAVLSICAARLGAGKVVAIELDPDAIGNAEANVAANRAEDVVHVIEGDAALLLPLVAPVGLVLANIISSVLLQLLPVIHDSLDEPGFAILSGILADEKEQILDALGERWMVLSTDTEEGWWSVLIERRQ
jgi:ribosomal protein L11 methyltransferase